MNLEMTRVFNAPRELVYRAFVDPDQLAQWFGPVGFSVPRESVDIEAKVGGHQRFTMVDDSDPSIANPIEATFSDVVENELLVGYQDVQFPGEPPVRFELRLEFADTDGGTLLTIHQGPYSPEMESGARQGWESSFTKLDTLLAA
ncbi:SRPBCC domain-containing protein [Actinocorallia longicatena]|uniref:Activator of Hsp90 ATPase homologue 1/2-like C-terminal domain-containing protein n=1 Tax=Actinocorallia longicatena TaxID=111803 RepID=A0ABP6Q322_9ACTN